MLCHSAYGLRLTAYECYAVSREPQPCYQFFSGNGSTWKLWTLPKAVT